MIIVAVFYYSLSLKEMLRHKYLQEPLFGTLL
jgi:hypothetical protein